MSSNISNPTDETSGWKPLVVSIIVSGLLSYSLCILVMKMLVGSPGAFEAVLGLSRDNFRFASFVAGFTFLISICGDSLLFAVLSQRRKWLTLIVAIGLPLIASALFALFVIAGLG